MYNLIYTSFHRAPGFFSGAKFLLNSSLMSNILLYTRSFLNESKKFFISS